MRLDGRNEKRVTMAIPVCLVTAEKLLFADQAMTVNVSSHGARVVTRRRWQLEEQPRLASSSGDLRTQAKVIYCETLTNGHFCIGLKFISAILDWEST
jgi:ubiquinone/menaquinone biosynthesis C-methylase UbiE